MGLESTLMEIAFSVVEGFSIVTAFFVSYILVDYLDKKIDYSIPIITILFSIIAILVSLVIFMPVHFLIGV